MSITFVVPGKPATRGSTKSIPYRRGLKLGVRTFDTSKKRTRSYMVAVHWAAKEAWRSKPSRKAMFVRIVWTLERPDSDWHDGKLRTSAPIEPIGHGCGDIDKLARAVLDAMTGVAYEDDAQVIALKTRKRYGQRYLTEITVGIFAGSDEACLPG